MFEKRIVNPGREAVKKDQMVFRCTPEEFDAITEAAKKAEMTKSNFIREAIGEKIERDG